MRIVFSRTWASMCGFRGEGADLCSFICWDTERSRADKTVHEFRWFQNGETRFSVITPTETPAKTELAKRLLSITITKTVTTNIHYRCCQTNRIAKILFDPAMMLPILYNIIIYQPLVPRRVRGSNDLSLSSNYILFVHIDKYTFILFFHTHAANILYFLWWVT